MSLRGETIHEPAGGDDAIVAALEGLPWLPYRRHFGLELAAAVRAGVLALDLAVEKGTDAGCVALVRRGDEVVAAMTLARQPFDTEIFGYEMGRSAFAFVSPAAGADADAVADLLLDTALEVLRGWGIEHFSLFFSGDDTVLTYAATRRGWFLADSTVDMTWDVAKEETRRGACTPDVQVRMSTPDDKDVLWEITYFTYTKTIRTRYATDPWLPLDGTGRLYARWAENACMGTFADAVSIAEIDGEIVGYDMLKLNPRLSEALGVGFAHKGLAATTMAARGKRVMSCVDAFLNQWQHDQGGRFNSGRVLFNNISMQKACAKCGGVNTGAFHTFHAWIGPEAPRPEASETE